MMMCSRPYINSYCPLCEVEKLNNIKILMSIKEIWEVSMTELIIFFG